MNIIKQTSKIRKCFGKHRNYVTLKNIDKFYSSLDIIEDTFEAIKAYKKENFPKKLGLKYLYIHGLLHCLYMQQDAIVSICKVLPIDFNYFNLFKNQILSKIRDTRNKCTGHPTDYTKNKRDKHEKYKYVHLTRITISKDNIELIKYPLEQEIIYEKINPLEIIDEQLTEINQLLNGINIKLKKINEEHLKKFRNIKLVNIIKDTDTGHFKEINNDKQIQVDNLNLIEEKYKQFEGALKERREDGYNIKQMLDLYIYAIRKAKGFLTNSSMDDFDIYNYYICRENKSFIGIAEEIDFEYSKEQTEYKEEITKQCKVKIKFVKSASKIEKHKSDNKSIENILSGLNYSFQKLGETNRTLESLSIIKSCYIDFKKIAINFDESLSREFDIYFYVISKLEMGDAYSQDIQIYIYYLREKHNFFVGIAKNILNIKT